MTASNEHITVTQYSRQDVLRILRIRLKQLCSWERSGLISQSDTYSFQDLVQLRKLRDLRATRLSVANIRASIHAMRRFQAWPTRCSKRVRSATEPRLAFRLSGAMMEPIARQFLFDFDSQRHSQLAEVSASPTHRPPGESRVQGLFFEAVRWKNGARRRRQWSTTRPFFRSIVVMHRLASTWVRFNTTSGSFRSGTALSPRDRGGPEIRAGLLRSGQCAGRATASARGDRGLHHGDPPGATLRRRALQRRAGL